MIWPLNYIRIYRLSSGGLYKMSLVVLDLFFQRVYYTVYSIEWLDGSYESYVPLII